MKKKKLYSLKKRGFCYESRNCETHPELYEQMKEELKSYKEQGIILRLSGREASSSRIAQTCCVRECGSYMRDYVTDDTGKLVEICFDKIR